MKEFMLYIRNDKDAKQSLSASNHLAFIKQCESYIRQLKTTDQLIAAQPLMREGWVIEKSQNSWIEKPLAKHTDIQVGYYHIRANDLDEAMTIAKNNPEFEYVPSAKIEIREVKVKEAETGFTYPATEQSN